MSNPIAPVEQTTEAGGQGSQPENETVAYETHRKLLAEKKKVQEELETQRKKLKELEDEKKQAQEKALKDKEDFKTLAEQREQEKLELQAKLKDKEDLEIRSSKLSRFLDEVNGGLAKEYWGLVDLDQVIIDPVTNEPDPVSVQKAAREFEKKYGRVLESENSKTLPNDAARKVTGKKLTVTEYNALETVKEQKEAYQNVDWNS